MDADLALAAAIEGARGGEDKSWLPPPSNSDTLSPSSRTSILSASMMPRKESISARRARSLIQHFVVPRCTAASFGAQLKTPKLAQKDQGFQDRSQKIPNCHTNDQTLQVQIQPPDACSGNQAVADVLKSRWSWSPRSLWKKVQNTRNEPSSSWS